MDRNEYIEELEVIRRDIEEMGRGTKHTEVSGIVHGDERDVATLLHLSKSYLFDAIMLLRRDNTK